MSGPSMTPGLRRPIQFLLSRARSGSYDCQSAGPGDTQPAGRSRRCRRPCSALPVASVPQRRWQMWAGFPAISSWLAVASVAMVGVSGTHACIDGLFRPSLAFPSPVFMLGFRVANEPGDRSRGSQGRPGGRRSGRCSAIGSSATAAFLVRLAIQPLQPREPVRIEVR